MKNLVSRLKKRLHLNPGAELGLQEQACLETLDKCLAQAGNDHSVVVELKVMLDNQSQDMDEVKRKRAKLKKML